MDVTVGQQTISPRQLSRRSENQLLRTASNVTKREPALSCTCQLVEWAHVMSTYFHLKIGPRKLILCYKLLAVPILLVKLLYCYFFVSLCLCLGEVFFL